MFTLLCILFFLLAEDRATRKVRLYFLLAPPLAASVRNIYSNKDNIYSNVIKPNLLKMWLLP